MSPNQADALEEIQELQLELADKIYNYWQTFSSFDTWQFWLNLAFLIIPLIMIYFLIDRKNALLLGFYGFNVHAWFTYSDAIGTTQVFWAYPYKVIPYLPLSIALDVSFVPVTYMLVYQWTLKHGKNYYLYTILYSAFLAFIFKPLLVSLGIFELHRNANYFILFLCYILVSILAKIITNIFIKFEKGT